MILLDTNVLSALIRSDPDAVVIDWVDAQPSESIWTTSATMFEIRTGLELLPSSRRRRHLEAAFERVLNEDLDQRVLSFDGAAADAAGAVVARRQRAGKAVETRDAQRAGTALARKATVSHPQHPSFQGSRRAPRRSVEAGWRTEAVTHEGPGSMAFSTLAQQLPQLRPVRIGTTQLQWCSGRP